MKKEIPDNICKFGATAEDLKQYEFLTDNQRLVLIARKKANVALEKIKSICGDDLSKYYKSINRYYKNNYHNYERWLFLNRLLLAILDEF